jgi:hypothetical protein
MGKYKQPKAIKGSQLFIQKLVNENCATLNKAISRILNANYIEWHSPIETDKFAEYRDNDALNKIDVLLNKRPLESFWPKQGPQWDALGLTDIKEPIFVEAKAHIDELFSAPLKASSEKSISLIKSSLNETANFLSASKGTDWSLHFYQYVNRIAHVYFLREL